MRRMGRKRYRKRRWHGQGRRRRNVCGRCSGEQGCNGRQRDVAVVHKVVDVGHGERCGTGVSTTVVVRWWEIGRYGTLFKVHYTVRHFIIRRGVWVGGCTHARARAQDSALVQRRFVSPRPHATPNYCCTVCRRYANRHRLPAIAVASFKRKWDIVVGICALFAK